MSVWQTYRQLLRNGPLSRLLLGEFFSSIGDWLYLVALVVLVYQETQDPVVLGIVGAARLLPYVFLSIPAGIVGDRFDRRYVLLVSDLVRMACMIALAWLVLTDAPIAAIAVVAIVAACFAPFFYPAFGALLPSLVRDESEFGPANSAWATLDNLAWVVGPGLAGVILLATGIELAFVVNAVTFLIIALILLTLPAAKARDPRPIGADSREVHDGNPAEPTAPGVPRGLERRSDRPTTSRRRVIVDRWLPRSIPLPPVGGVVLLDMLTWFAFGGINILIVVLAIDTFKGGEAATGFLSAATGVGGVLGAVLSGVLVLRPTLRPAMILASAAFAAALVLLGVADTLTVAFVAIAVASVGHLILDVVRTTILQRVVPDAYRGRFTGVLMTTSGGSEALGTLVVPIVAVVAGLPLVLAVTAGALFGGTILSLALIGRAGDFAAGPFDAELRQIVRLPVFGGISPSRLERALRQLEPVRVGAGAVVIREGDVADRFFVIASGRFEVTQLGPGGVPRVLRTLERHDVFGERGLLARSPRTATVTASADGLLFVLDGASFLETVGARRDVADRLLGLYQPAETPVRG